MTIDKTYTRVSPSGDKSEVTPENYKQVEYHRELAERGFRYTPMVTIHRSEQSCAACEG